jgi:hypothetical protein
MKQTQKLFKQAGKVWVLIWPRIIYVKAMLYLSTCMKRTQKFLLNRRVESESYFDWSHHLEQWQRPSCIFWDMCVESAASTTLACIKANLSTSESGVYRLSICARSGLCLSCRHIVSELQAHYVWVAGTLCVSCRHTVSELQAHYVWVAGTLCLSCRHTVSELQAHCVWVAGTLCLSCRHTVSELQAHCVW